MILLSWDLCDGDGSDECGVRQAEGVTGSCEILLGILEFFSWLQFVATL